MAPGRAAVLTTGAGERVRAHNALDVDVNVLLKSIEPGFFDVHIGPAAASSDTAVEVLVEQPPPKPIAIDKADPAASFQKLLAPIFQMAWSRGCDKKFAAEIARKCGGDLVRFERRIHERFGIAERLARATLHIRGLGDEERRAEYYRYFSGIVADELRAGGHRSGIFMSLADDIAK